MFSGFDTKRFDRVKILVLMFLFICGILINGLKRGTCIFSESLHPRTLTISMSSMEQILNHFMINVHVKGLSDL